MYFCLVWFCVSLYSSVVRSAIAITLIRTCITIIRTCISLYSSVVRSAIAITLIRTCISLYPSVVLANDSRVRFSLYAGNHPCIHTAATHSRICTAATRSCIRTATLYATNPSRSCPVFCCQYFPIFRCESLCY
ncbi:MAG: hypothetical protein Ta2D_00550 [Rickettsiales bacterium]|nr:MAG: hypothetical protein Ta2D_00550 [Rickettsiales bacterium]